MSSAKSRGRGWRDDRGETSASPIRALILHTSHMEYKIVGDVMQALKIQLAHNEELYAEAGAMLYMGDGIELNARMQGGFMKGLMRKFLAGESMFMSVFKSNVASGHL